MKAWYRISNAVDPTIAEIQITDVIGSWDDDWIARNFGYDMGVTARAFVEELSKLPNSVKALKVHINSPGGDVQAGINIANALRDQQISKGRAVETIVDGIAASIASVIAMAGSTVRMADNALMMIHNPWGLEIGSAAEMRKTADVLDTMRDQIVATYRWHSSLEPDAIIALLDAETWMNADEAIAQGFATDKIEGLKAAASIHPLGLAALKVPERYKARVDAWLRKDTPAPVAATTDEIVDACDAAGCPELVKTLRGSGATLEQVQAKVTEAKAAREAAAAAAIAATVRADAITALCVKTKQPELAAGYISGAMTVDAVKAHLVIVTANQDRVEIDTYLDPRGGAKGRAGKDVFGVFGKDTKE